MQIIVLFNLFLHLALFYGESKDTVVGDWILGLWESFFGFFPVWLMKFALKKRKPSEKDEGGMKSKINLFFKEKTRSLDPDVHEDNTDHQVDVHDGDDGDEDDDEDTVELGYPTDAGHYRNNDETAGGVSTVKPKTKNPPQSPKYKGGKKKNENFAAEILSPREDFDLESKESDYNKDVASASFGQLQKSFSVRRRTLYENQYILPTWCKWLLYIFMGLWSIACAIITVLFCVYFESQVDSTENGYESEIETNCSFKDVTLQNILNYNITQSAIVSEISSFSGNLYDPPKSDSFGEYDTSARFILAILWSFALSLTIWSPLLALVEALWYYSRNQNTISSDDVSQTARMKDVASDSIEMQNRKFKHHIQASESGIGDATVEALKSGNDNDGENGRNDGGGVGDETTDGTAGETAGDNDGIGTIIKFRNDSSAGDGGRKTTHTSDIYTNFHKASEIHQRNKSDSGHGAPLVTAQETSKIAIEKETEAETGAGDDNDNGNGDPVDDANK